jgi:hypothetical protein
MMKVTQELVDTVGYLAELAEWNERQPVLIREAAKSDNRRALAIAIKNYNAVTELVLVALACQLSGDDEGCRAAIQEAKKKAKPLGSLE